MTDRGWTRGWGRWFLLATASGVASAQSIYTCVDAKGRRITSDRPIAECLDREQKELNPSGTVKRTVQPSLTGAERSAEEERQRRLLEDQTRLQEERRRDRALLARYQDQAAHDAERSSALSHVDEVVKVAQMRIVELGQQRKAIDAEFEFYKKDPSKAPTALKLRLQENEQGIEAQKRFIQDQEQEKKRVNTRFDVELTRLRQLWGPQAPSLVSPASSSAAR